MPNAGLTDASRMTLGRHVLEMQRQHPGARGELSVLLLQLAFAGKIFSHALRRAAFADRLGSTGGRNVQGEATKKLDDFGNAVIVEAFARTELVSAIVSEEMDEPHQLAAGSKASYVLCVDPLDGSSNSDVNGAVATIFGIFRPSGRSGAARVEDVRSGHDQVAAGYIMYGPSTMLVYTTGAGVHGFTLDHDVGEFVLTHPDMRCPERGPYYAANIGKAGQWAPSVRAYVDALTAKGERPHSLRYTGAFIADLHRCLVDGGVYFYPPDADYPEGKLRLAYECAPMAFVIEQAGGAATTGAARVMDIPMAGPHQRVPLAIGSRAEVELYERFSRGDA
jgi:fructose-1,6-bisphosphatase I